MQTGNKSSLMELSAVLNIDQNQKIKNGACFFQSKRVVPERNSHNSK